MNQAIAIGMSLFTATIIAVIWVHLLDKQQKHDKNIKNQTKQKQSQNHKRYTIP